MASSPVNEPIDYGVWLDDHALPIVESYGTRGRVGLTDDQFVSFLVWTLNGEVGNGGTDQYFFNAGDLARETAAALEAIGAHRTASSFLEFCRFFPDGFPDASIAVVREQYDQLPSEFFDACGRFDTCLMGTAENDYKVEENLAGLLHHYVSKKA